MNVEEVYVTDQRSGRTKGIKVWADTSEKVLVMIVKGLKTHVFSTRNPGYLLYGPRVGGETLHRLQDLLLSGLNLNEEDRESVMKRYKKELLELCHAKQMSARDIDRCLGTSNSGAGAGRGRPGSWRK